MEDIYKKINYILVQLINEIWELEAKAIITDMPYTEQNFREVL